MVNKLPKEIKKAWLVKNILDALGTIVGFGIIYFVLKIFVDKNWLHLTLIVWTVLFALVILFDLIQILLIPYIYNFWTYQITGEFVELHKGYIFRKQITIPLVRLQTVTLEAGPILRWQNLTELYLHTASSSEKISGLRLEDAKKFRKQLLTIIQKAGDTHE